MDIQHQFSNFSRSPKITEGMNLSFNVSFVDVEENLLKLWIQPEPSLVRSIESVMRSLHTRLEKSGGYMHQCQLSVNGHYCVKPTESDCWFRARVIKHAPNDGTFVIVHFIDYGHTGVIRVTNVRPLEEKLYSLPPQAIKCVMAEVASATGEAWHKEAADYIRKVLSQTEVTGTVVSKYLDIPYIRVFVNGISLAHHLIEKGIGIPLASSLEPSASQMVIYNGETFRALPLDVTKEHLVYVSHVESCNKFYIQLACKEHELNILMEEIKRHAVEQGFYPLEEILPGSPCIAQFSEDSNFYRAVITKVTPPTCCVTYIDYGNSENKSHYELKAIPQKFLIITAQAKECKLFTDVIIDTDTFRSLVDDKLLTCRIKEQQSSSYVVTLYHDGENIIKSNESTLLPSHSQPLMKQSFNYNYLELHLNSTYDIYVSYIRSPLNFYCNLHHNNILLKNLMDKVSALCEMTNPEINAISINECFPGQSVCCKYSADQQWYRAVILSSVQNSSVPVQFVDYGNEEVAHISVLRKITPELLELPVQAIKCHLVNMEMFSLDILMSDSVIAEMEKLMLNVRLVIKFEDKKNDTYFVSVFDASGICINTKLQEFIQRNYLQNRQFTDNVAPSNIIHQNSIVDNSLPNKTNDMLHPEIPIGALEEVLVTDVLSPSSFHCQLQKDNCELDILMDELTAHYASLDGNKEVIDNCVVGMVCVAKYSEDDSWYRAKIINTFPPNTVEVFFVDYGNKETTNKSNVKKISSEFLNVSFKAVECSLANVDLRNIVPEMIKKFRDLVLNNTFTAVFKGVESGVYKVELLDSEENKISEKFQNLMINESVTTTNLHVNSEENWNENFGVDENKNSSNYDNWNDKNDKYACNEWEEPTKTTTMANNSHSFWNDEAEPAVDSSKFSSKIKCTSHNLWNDGLDSANDSSKFSSNENKFSSDWKKSKTDDTREKRFSKYDKSNNFRNEPDERKNNSWSKGNTWNNGGLKSAQERRGKSKPDQWHYNDHHGSGDESTLNSNNRKAYKNERSPRSTNQEQQGSLENLTDFKYIEITIGDFRYVNVPNVVNPNEFYCRFMDDNNELLGMTEQLAQFYENINYGEYILENIHIGKPCCILSKDNNWCRGKIESITVDSANVFCVDYGCFENVLLKDIKVLKPEFLKVPMQILKCNSQGIQAKESSWNEEDISLFKNMTQDKCFLAQFLNKHSENTYSVTLLSVNALTEANVNKEFLKTGHDIKEPQDSAPSLKLPYSLSVQTDIPHAIIKIGDRLEITVTWVFTVERFYCQLTSYSSDFEEMMVSVQKTYSKMQELEAVIEKPNVDLYCVAQFSEDKAWYRAKIVYVEGNKIGVRYIDYGNEEVVGRKRIKYILPQFASLPIQAIKCQLNGIKCLDYKVNEDLVQKYFAGKIMCTFNSFIDDIYVVDLESNGKSISQLLIRDRLASPSDDYIPPTSEEPVRITFLNADLSHKINKSMDVLISYVESPYKFWCQLLDDSEKLDEITNSITTYYNELSDDSENLTQFQINTLCIAKYTVDNEWYRAVIKSCDADQAEVMFIDYGNSDIVPLSQIKVITEDLSNIPAQAVECSLHEIPPSLSEDEQKKFVDFTSENEIKMIINKCNADGTLVVTLLTSSETEEINVGEKLYGELMQDGEVFPSMPDSHESVPGYVTSVNSISEFFVQLSSKDDDLSKLMADLTDAYASLSTTDLALNTITQNKIYCAKYSEDNNWYRAVIKDVNGDDVTVFFIDYGNIDVIPREDVKILKEEFCKIPSFCYRCRLAYIKPIDDEWSTEAIDWFTTYILDKTLNICFKHEENPYPVMILNEENDNISDLLIQEKFAVSADELFGDAVSANEVIADAVSADEVIADAVSADEVPADAVSADEVIADTVSANEVIADAISADEVPADVVFANEVFDHFDWHIPDNKSGSESDEVVHLEDGTFPIIPRYRPTGTVRVIVSHVESADRFYVTPVNKLDNLEKLQEKLQAFYEKEHEKHENIERILMFQPCVTKFSLDERWYRAEIIHLSESSVTVKFVDYGNSETVTKDDLRNMHKKFISVPAFSLECSLADLTANSEKLDEARTLLEDLINEKEIDITIISNELPLSVCIISDKENIYNQLTESGLYTHTPQPEKVQYSYIILPSDCKIEVIISHALSPSQFYVQLPENKLELDTFMTDILNKYQSEQPTLEEFAVGDLCIAYYSVDQGWYRAMITAIQDDDYVKVIYVDYGNQEVVPKDSIKEILPEFKDLPFQAVNCSLTKMHDDNWDEEHCLMFQEMVVSDEKTFELECVANHITFYEVKLLDNGTNITEILIEKGLVSAADQENIKNVSDDEMVENIEEQYIDNTSNVQVLEKDLSVISEESINSSVQQNDSEFSTKEVMSTPVSKHKPEMKYIPEDISAVDSNNDLSQFQELDTTFYTSAEDTSDFIKSENIPLNQPSKVEIQSSVQQTLTDETNDRKIEDDDVISKDKDDYEAEECSKDFYENTDDSCKYEAELTSVSAKKYDEDIIDDVMGSEMPEMLYEMKSDDKDETEIQESFFSVETYGDDKIINEENDFADNSFQDSETNFVSDSIRADTGMCLSRIKLDKESEDEQMIDIPADTFHSKEVDLLDPIDLKNETDDTNFQDFSLEEDFQNDKIQETTSDQYLYKAGSVVDIKKEDCIAKSLSTNSEKALSEECRDLNNSSPSSAYSSEGQEIPGSCKSPEEKIVPGQISYVNLSKTESCERLKEQFLKDGISIQDTGTVSPSDSKELVSDGPRKSSLEEKIVPGQVSYLGKNE